jgi:hypothetical protein
VQSADARGEAEGRRTDAGAEVAYRVPGLGRNRSGKHHRIEASSESLPRLADLDPAAEECVDRCARLCGLWTLIRI